jgi:DNA sulfur modification protein DndB
MSSRSSERPELGVEEVATIFIKGVSATHREADPNGFERTRRLFTTLNSRAKAVSKRDIIALDEDDVIAITTRYLIEEHPLFVDKVFPKGTKSIPPTEKTALITIVGLYDALDALFFDEVEQLDLGKQKRPDDTAVKSFLKSAREWYGLLVKSFLPLKEMHDADPAEKTAGKYRGPDGGHFLFRPLGFVMLHKVAGWLQQDGFDMKQAVRRLATVPMQLNGAPWVGLVWDDVNGRMINAPENRKAAEKLLYYAAGGNLADLKSSEPDLRKELSGLMNLTPRRVPLRRYVR